jgi:NAD-dependent dihydropyrimidine dehydrogenase PreA subunit
MKYLNNVVTLKLDIEKCIGCGRCMEVCPRQVFEMRDKKAEIIDRDRCIECGACQRNCAFGAVIVKSGVGCAQALFNALLTGGEPVCGCEKNAKKTSGCC